MDFKNGKKLVIFNEESIFFMFYIFNLKCMKVYYFFFFNVIWNCVLEKFISLDLFKVFRIYLKNIMFVDN